MLPVLFELYPSSTSFGLELPRPRRQNDFTIFYLCIFNIFFSNPPFSWISARMKVLYPLERASRTQRVSTLKKSLHC